MAKQTQKHVSGSTARIWSEAKKQLQKLVESRAKKEKRPVSEAEIVSKAVGEMYEREKV
jgi:hypothetical protein